MDGTVSDLQALAQQWGDKFSQHYGTTCKWVDLHAKKSEMAKFQFFKISARTNSGLFEGSGTATDIPGVTFEDSFTNESSEEQKMTFKRSTTITSTFTWTVKEGLDIGVPLSAAVGLPGVAFSTVSLNPSISVSSTESVTETETKDWEVDEVHRVPPRHKLEIAWTVNKKRYAGVFTSDIILGGCIAIKTSKTISVADNPYKSGEHKLWFIPIDRVFKEMKEWGIVVPSQYSIGDGIVKFKASGELEGEAASHPSFSLKQSALP